ncbi:MAG: hypothetical protein JWO82_4268 [Akkermansiaceae bacterium]|nr:hypothetical protein [Akkermansiaceae bacterium]
MPNKLHEREHARRMLIEWCTVYMQAGDLQEAALALPLPDGRQLEIGLRMSEAPRAVALPAPRRPVRKRA